MRVLFCVSYIHVHSGANCDYCQLQQSSTSNQRLIYHSRFKCTAASTDSMLHAKVLPKYKLRLTNQRLEGAAEPGFSWQRPLKVNISLRLASQLNSRIFIHSANSCNLFSCGFHLWPFHCQCCCFHARKTRVIAAASTRGFATISVACSMSGNLGSPECHLVARYWSC